MAMTGMICICTSVIVCVPFKKGCLASVIAEKIFRDAKQLSLSMSGMMLFRDISCKYLFSRPLGGGGGYPGL